MTSKQIYPPEGFTPPIWGLTVSEFGVEGQPFLQMTIQGEKHSAYIAGTRDQIAQLINQLQLLMSVLTLTGRGFEESGDWREALIKLIGGFPRNF